MGALSRFPKSVSIVQNTVVMRLPRVRPALSLLRQEAGPQAGIPTRGMVTKLGVAARVGADRRKVLLMWHYKNFVQSGEWALTVIAPAGGWWRARS